MTEQLFEVTALYNSTKRQLFGLRSETSILFGVKKINQEKIGVTIRKSELWLHR